MKTLLLRLVLATMCMVAAASANAQAGDWGNFVFVSSTLGNNANKLCLGEGLRGSDIGCPTYAPTVLPNGNVGIGTLSPSAMLQFGNSVTSVISDTNMIRLYDNGAGNHYGFGVSAGRLGYRADTHVFFVPSGSNTQPFVMMTGASNNNRMGIGTMSPAVSLSVIGEVQVSNSGVACSGTTKGSIRYSTTSNTLEYCNSSAWTGVTNSTDASLTAFTATKSANQTLAAGAVVTWDATTTNNGNAFNLATERFVAPGNGFYFFVFSGMNNADTTNADFYIAKNGFSFGLRGYGGSGSETYKNTVAQGIVYLAAGDYVDVRSTQAGQTLFGTNPGTTFSGFLLNAGFGSSTGDTGLSAMASLTDVLVCPSSRHQLLS